MVRDMQETIRETNKVLRKNALHTILEQLDNRVMQINKKERKKKYNKMKQDPYNFFRGSAYLFYYDVSRIPFQFHTPADKPTWIMGDMHLDNFSTFEDEEGNLVFDVDDFDEGYLGSYLYDLLRMVVSIRLTAEKQGITDDKDEDKLVKAYLKSYRKQLKKFTKQEEDPVTTVFTIENTKGPIKKALKKLEERKETHELTKQTITNEDGVRVFDRNKEKLKEVSANEYKAIQKAWDDYQSTLPIGKFKEDHHFEIKDIVKKLGSGVSSTGLNRYFVLIEGNHPDKNKDDIILEVKEARPPVPAYFFEYNENFWQHYNHQGERVIDTQKAMHHKADPYLGFMDIGNRSYYVRERSAFDKDIDHDDFTSYKAIEQTVKTMGKISAKIHARADADVKKGLLAYHSEEAILDTIEQDRKGFTRELVTWSRFYKKQVEEDYEYFLEWLETYFYKNKKEN
ncbi:DUF2252 domain-containing protein [Saliterribacillus persicus]|uniref:Uncharacterized protein (DUF2252 family) n=1 Tax=Saliterribacillus persicus TaxID=930114 RepID=A0A368XF11_9BACI|nr:DUF2252 family protein [Saliterribacillus persicus]RCW65806.1 uncharacterized protein (DUF2252 family) [Saliterribacillus persicus]